MRKLIVTNIVSLDGYYEGPGGNVMVLPMDPSFDAYNAERLRSADTLLLGRRTYEGFKGFWPDPLAAAERMGIPRERVDTPVHREISERENRIEKLVVSDTLTETAPWQDTTRVVPRAEAHAAISALKQQEGGDILVFGSRTLWNDLLVAGLVDELHLIVGAIVLGDGTPAFAAPRELRLMGTRRFEGSNNLLVRYSA
jgi:dihydrofolate reductase